MKKVLSIVLCLGLVFTTFTDNFAFAKGINNSGLSYDPEYLMDLLPQAGAGTSRLK
jgi:hypothetical protein